MSERLSPVAYQVTETDLDGATFCHVRGWDASHANHMVNRFIRKADDDLKQGREPGHVVDPATDATGRLVLRRLHRSFGNADGEVIERWRTWELTPVVKPSNLSEPMADDLGAVLGSSHYPGDRFDRVKMPGGVLRLVKVGAKIEERISCSGMYSIPPASWRRLVAKGWASLLTDRVEPCTPFRVSVSGLVALALREHQTRTSSPTGHYRNESGTRMYDGSSAAVCSAGCLAGRWNDRRVMAQGVTRQHRAEVVLRALGASEEQAARAGKRAFATPRPVAA